MGVIAQAAFHDLAEVRQDLEAVRLGLGRELTAIVRDSAASLARGVARRTPRGPGPNLNARQGSGARLPHVSDTIRATSTASSVLIGSDHPAAGPLNFGGTIAPRGVPIELRAHEMAQKALRDEGPRFERDLAGRIDDLLARHGLT